MVGIPEHSVSAYPVALETLRTNSSNKTTHENSIIIKSIMQEKLSME
jgi:hypothetical protein